MIYYVHKTEIVVLLPHAGLWKVGEKGEPERVENIPLKVYYPPESKKGIWGGEGWVIGAKYTRPNHKVINLYLPIIVLLKYLCRLFDFLVSYVFHFTVKSSL